MKYQIAGITIFFSMITLSQQVNIDEYANKTEELKAIKIKLQKDAMQHHEQLFSNLQMYGRVVGQVATSAIVLAGQVTGDKNQSNHARLSTGDCTNIVQAVVAGFILMVEVARLCHARAMHKKIVHFMRYSDFVANFPHLVLVEYQIILMKTLIQLSQNGDFGQQIFARIALTKMSLPYPFEKFANKAAKKMFKKSFDKFGNFVWTELYENKDPYKKFTKKVAQNWKDIALCAKSFSEVIEPEYCSTVALLIDTPYNNALVTMIDAGMQGDLQTVQKIKKDFQRDDLIEKLEQFYSSCHSKLDLGSR